ncbi:MAG: hypothetical protein IPF79_05780 [Ignavibacteria bacterium]|nr:hypothetical protein [Ignavibacteria bacterium]
MDRAVGKRQTCLQISYQDNYTRNTSTKPRTVSTFFGEFAQLNRILSNHTRTLIKTTGAGALRRLRMEDLSSSLMVNYQYAVLEGYLAVPSTRARLLHLNQRLANVDDPAQVLAAEHSSVFTAQVHQPHHATSECSEQLQSCAVADRVQSDRAGVFLTTLLRTVMNSNWMA